MLGFMFIEVLRCWTYMLGFMFIEVFEMLVLHVWIHVY